MKLVLPGLQVALPYNNDRSRMSQWLLVFVRGGEKAFTGCLVLSVLPAVLAGQQI
jgi:hypothetical protein